MNLEYFSNCFLHKKEKLYETIINGLLLYVFQMSTPQ